MPDKILKIDLWVRVMVPTYSGGIINEPHISLDLELKVKLLGSVMQMLTHFDTEVENYIYPQTLLELVLLYLLQPGASPSA